MTSVGAPKEFLSPLTALAATFVPSSAGLAFPMGLAFDGTGTLIVSDNRANTLSQVTPDGSISTFVAASAGLSSPVGLAFDTSGNLYVANGGNNTVSEVTPNGSVTTFVPESAGLDYPYGLAFDSSGSLYVTTPRNNTVSKVTTSGIITTFVPSSAGLATPLGLTFDKTGNLYVANGGNNTVSEVAPDGTVSTFVPESAGLSYPNGLAFDPKGNLYVSNTNNNTVSEVTPGGVVSTYVPASAGLSYPYGMAFDGLGSLYAASADNSILKIPPTAPSFTVSDADAARLAAIGLTLNADGIFSGTVTSLPSSNPFTFTAMATNDLGDSGSALISLTATQPVISPTSLKMGAGAVAGLPPLTVTGQGNQLTTLLTFGGIVELASIASDNTGNLYLSDIGHLNQVFKVTPDGGLGTLLSRADFGTDDPCDVACDSKGNLFVAYVGLAGNYLIKVTPDGQHSTFVSGLPAPTGMAIDSNDNIYVANGDNNTVTKVTPGGSISTFVSASAGLAFPFGLAFDSSGNLYVANYGNSTVSVVTPGGVVSTIVPASAGLASPSGLTFDSSGNLYVANYGTGTVSEVTPDGTVSTLIPASAGLLNPVGLAFDSKGILSGIDAIISTLWNFGPAAPTFAISTTDADKLAAIGLTFHADGTFSGIVTSLPSPNPLTFTVTMTDAIGDWASAVINLTVDPTPEITSTDHTTFAVGLASTFTVTVTGYPTPTLSEAGALPDGVTFDTTTGVLSGKAASGTVGSYPISFTASNGVGSDATQNFTLNVGIAPAITSAASTTFAVGAAASFTVTATAFPPPTLSEFGALPVGVTFNSSTGLLSGTPHTGTGGSYPITFRASNGVGSDATQSFTLIVNQPPAITSATITTFTAGASASFAVTVTGFPTATLSEMGALPAGVSFDPITGNLNGKPAADAGGIYPITFRASNGVGSDATQSFTLVVNQEPTFTSAASALFPVGQVSTFTVQITGYPTPGLSEFGALPVGVRFDANSRTLSGVPAAGTTGSYPITFSASNGVGNSAMQAFTLNVSQLSILPTTLETSVGDAATQLPAITATGEGNVAPTIVPVSAGLALPTGLAFDSSGNLYVANAAGNTVSKVTPGGAVSTFVPASAGLSMPRGLAFDSGGNLYVSNGYANTVSKVTPSGQVSTFLSASDGVAYPHGLAFDSSGNLYVANYGVNTVSKVTPDGIVSTFVHVVWPDGLAFDGSGNLYVTNGNDYTVYKVTPEGSMSTFVPASAGLSLPSGLAFDKSGNLYVSNYSGDTVSKVTPDGSVTTFVRASAGLSGPTGLAFDASGKLYVANRDNNTVSEIAPAASSYAVSAADANNLAAIGLTLNADGSFSGTVTSLPSSNPLVFTVIVTNDLGEWGSAAISLIVNQPSAITSAASAIFVVGLDSNFSLTVVGYPTPTLSEAGTLPDGVTFDTTTGVLSGTPGPGRVGNYPITFTASNGVGSDATQDFTLTVNEASAISSAASATFVVGVGSTFAVMVNGYPTPTLSEVGVLPDGVDFDSTTGILSGAAAPGSRGIYPIVFTASNGVGGDATQPFTLTVNQIGTISGVIFSDSNVDGLQQGTEPGLPGNTEFLDLDNNGNLDSGEPTAVTDASGFYQFTGLASGTYAVRQDLQGGVLLSTPAGGSYQATVAPGGTVSGAHFGDVLTSIAVPLTLPPATPFPKQGNANGDFVEAVYRAVLKRDADAGGLASWVTGLDTSTLTRLQVVQGIVNSPEHFGLEVDAFYQTLLGREADASGRSYWVGQLQDGVREEEVTASFLGSPEVVGQGDKSFVERLYWTLLGRQADPGGEAVWLDALGDDASGNPTHPHTLTHQQVITDFLYSGESLSRMVEGNYEVYLQRRSESAGLNEWISLTQQGLPFASIGKQFLASDEFFARAAANG